MKQFQPYEKVLVKVGKKWCPTFYAYPENNAHIVFGFLLPFADDRIISLQGNEKLIGIDDSEKVKYTRITIHYKPQLNKESEKILVTNLEHAVKDLINDPTVSYWSVFNEKVIR